MAFLDKTGLERLWAHIVSKFVTREEFNNMSVENFNGIVPIENGGTASETVMGAITTLGIQAGKVSNGGNTDAQDTKDIKVTFPTPYTEGVTPIVVVGFATTSTAYGMGRCSCTAMNITNTGFTIRFYNYDANARNPYYSWISFGNDSMIPDAAPETTEE